MLLQENVSPSRIVESNGKAIKCYDDEGKNIDKETVNSFGEEWKAFHGFSDEEVFKVGDRAYFDILTAEMSGPDKIAIDFGCGSGRWTKYAASKFGTVAAIDPSDAIFSASSLLKNIPNVSLYKAAIDTVPFPDGYFDFGFSLGVLHHIPDTQKAMVDCVKKIRKGGYFLVYLYYNLDNRGLFFKLIFWLSNIIRLIVSHLPGRVKRAVCDTMAVLIYMPFVGLSRLLRLIGVPVSVRRKIPLQIYEDTSFYMIRNDSLDRFGTPLEQRFSRDEIQLMMINAGLTDIVFSEKEAYWHAIGKKK
jgi:SAM-dependent methyltransferase